MVKETVVAFGVALIAVAASADLSPENWAFDSLEVKLCDAETGTGNCQRANSQGVDDEIVWVTKAFSSVTVDLSESVGAFTCTVQGNNVGHDAAGGVGQTLHSPALTQSAYSVTLTAPPTYIWVNCTQITTSVTAVAYGRQNR